MENNTTFTFPLVLTDELVGNAIRDYSYATMNDTPVDRLSADTRFLYEYSNADAFRCSCCQTHVGVTLYGDADEYASWTDIVLLDTENDNLSVMCVPCYETEIVEVVS